MSLSKRFIDRPIATSLIMAAIAIAGISAFLKLPVSSLPAMEFPTIVVSASLPGADPETMASSVAAPLERQLSQISNVVQLTSTSQLGSTSISLQFSLERNIDAAAQDVAAAINAAGGLLPKNMPNPPRYRKTNPAEQPLLIFAAYSDSLSIDQVDKYADTVVAQQLSVLPGVGDVNVQGEQKPAIRVQIDPAAIANQGLSLEDVRGALTAANINAPKGSINGEHQSSIITTNDQLSSAAEFRDVIVAYRKGAPVRISDIGTAIDGVENARLLAWQDDKRAVILSVSRQPGANAISTVETIKAKLPGILAGIPKSMTVRIVADRTNMIRSSVSDIELTLVLTIVLVIAVIFFFLRKVWATIIPGMAVPLSILGAFVIMAFVGYSVDTLSLMAMTIAVGFVVDDAIVMLENIVRHMERGESAYDASVRGAQEIGSTIVSMTFSLVAVFIPLLLMGGIVGRLFREFAVTVAVAVLISGAVSLTVTPALCAQFLTRDKELHGRFYSWAERFLQGMIDAYAKLLRVALRHKGLVGASVLVTIVITGLLFYAIPKGFFPLQDTGLIRLTAQGAPDVSYAEMLKKMRQVTDIVLADPAVEEAHSYVGENGGNGGRVNFDMKPFEERDVSVDEIIARLRPKLTRIPGLDVRMISAQEITVGARQTRAQFQYTLQDQNIDELHQWADVMYEKLRAIPELEDMSTDQQNAGLRTHINVDRDSAARLGVTLQQIDDTLYDAFGQRQVGTIFTQVNQYKVVLEIDPKQQGSPDVLNKIFVKSSSGQQVPLAAVATVEPETAPLFVGHQGQFPATTISFNLAPGVALGTAIDIVQQVERDVHLPATVTPSFQGNAQAFQDSMVTMPLLIAAAIITVYIVLGILYESYIHPITILSTIPSAGIGALLVLWVFGFALDMIALIGILLLIGIVKKNAIMMVDFALEGERERGLSPEEAIYQAAIVRFRPIMMTTMCALLAGIPLMLINGAGAELRRPLGFAIVGGLVFSQLLTLFTTPVVYLYMHKLADRFSRNRVRAVERVFNPSVSSPLSDAAE